MRRMPTLAGRYIGRYIYLTICRSLTGALAAINFITHATTSFHLTVLILLCVAMQNYFYLLAKIFKQSFLLPKALYRALLMRFE